jgi:hypothetical protein
MSKCSCNWYSPCYPPLPDLQTRRRSQRVDKGAPRPVRDGVFVEPSWRHQCLRQSPARIGPVGTSGRTNPQRNHQRERSRSQPTVRLGRWKRGIQQPFLRTVGNNCLAPGSILGRRPGSQLEQWHSIWPTPLGGPIRSGA